MCAGLGKVDQGQPVEDLCPDGSYVIPFEQLNTATFDTQAGPPPDQMHFAQLIMHLDGQNSRCICQPSLGSHHPRHCNCRP